MRELELAGLPSLDAPRSPGERAPFPLSRKAFALSVVAHVVAGYALSRQVWPTAPPQQNTIAEFFLFELPPPQPAPVAPEVVEPVPEVPDPPRVEPPAPAPRAADVVVEPPVTVERTAPEPVPTTPVPPAPSAEELEEARQRAAEQVVTERSAENEYLTFSIDDIAPPRPEPEPKPARSIFDGGGERGGGRSVATVGQQRTRFGRKLAELCNALTGGFGVGFQGFGLFSACASPDSEPSGLFPEVRPAYLDLMPECVDTRDTAPALALEAPFPTVKCRLVGQEEPEELGR
jgi:hypothetical protein